jgi:hypothetical protein
MGNVVMQAIGQAGYQAQPVAAYYFPSKLLKAIRLHSHWQQLRGTLWFVPCLLIGN